MIKKKISQATYPHGPHLVGLVEEAAATSLEQELDVLVNAAARKLSGQMESVMTKKHKGRSRHYMTRK